MMDLTGINELASAMNAWVSNHRRNIIARCKIWWFHSATIGVLVVAGSVLVVVCIITSLNQSSPAPPEPVPSPVNEVSATTPVMRSLSDLPYHRLSRTNDSSRPNLELLQSDPAQYGIEVLEYLQGLANAANLPVFTVNYAIVALGPPVECSTTQQPYTIDGTDVRRMVRWCPVIQALALNIEGLRTKGHEEYALRGITQSYSRALAAAMSRGYDANFDLAACIHGALAFRQVLDGTDIDAGRLGQDYYEDDTSAFNSGFASGHCR